jgi:hypothetical protein
MDDVSRIRPFDRCPASDGYHCITNSLAKIFRFHGQPLSEDMLLGLGAGLGFMYWKTKAGGSASVFVGGRGNHKGFFADLGSRTGVDIREVRTASAAKAEAALLERLRAREPVMLFGDMGMLPWFDFPEGYHFGGHSFVACGFDGEDRVLASDMDPKAAGLKKGFCHEISLERLREARGSTFKPFPPGNARVDFDFGGCRAPRREDLRSAIAQVAASQLGAPTRSFGIKGLRYAASELPKWRELFPEPELRDRLFDLYVFIEIGGTGGGCFRSMYARFLREAASLAGIKPLLGPADEIERSGRTFSELAGLFKDAWEVPDLDDRMEKAGELFGRIAYIEEGAFAELARIVV